MEIGLNFANLKAFGNLFKDIERSKIPVTSLTRTSAPSFVNVPGSLSMPVAFVLSISFKILCVDYFSAASKSNLLVSLKWMYWATQTKRYWLEGLGSFLTGFSTKFEK